MWIIDLSQALEGEGEEAKRPLLWRRIRQNSLRPPPQHRPLLALRENANELLMISSEKIGLGLWVYDLAYHKWHYAATLDEEGQEDGRYSYASSSYPERVYWPFLLPSCRQHQQPIENEKETEERETENESEKGDKRKDTLFVYVDGSPLLPPEMLRLQIPRYRWVESAIPDLKELAKVKVAFLPEYATICMNLQQLNAEEAVQYIINNTETESEGMVIK